MKQIFTTLLSGAALMLLCGCFDVQDDLTIAPDGSGQVALTVKASIPDEMLSAAGMGYGRQGLPFYPPVNENEARQFFPSQDFSLKVEENTAGETKTIAIVASFKDINALLASPYGKAHQLEFKTNADALNLRALSGGSVLASLGTLKPGEFGEMRVPNPEELEKKKAEMRVQFRVTLPNTISNANGATTGKTVTWSFERAKSEDDAHFSAKVSGVLEAACSLEGVAFAPATPPRLGLVPFGELAAGTISAASGLPDTNQIASAGRFIPCTLRVTRSLDLSGESYGVGSQAQLLGAFLLPPDLEPHRWGQPKLEEVIDAAGNNLMPGEDDRGGGGFMRYSGFDMETGPEEEEADEQAPKTAAQKPHFVSLQFKAPEWSVKQIARIRGVVELQYLGGSEILKLSNAVPADLVMDTSGGGRSRLGFESRRARITDSRLSALGLSLRAEIAMVQGGMTMLSLQVSGKAPLLDAQVFDAAGKPWATTLVQDESPGQEERWCQVMVAGKPKPPFSLALVVGGVGASVSLPILLEEVPVDGK